MPDAMPYTDTEEPKPFLTYGSPAEGRYHSEDIGKSRFFAYQAASASGSVEAMAVCSIPLYMCAGLLLEPEQLEPEQAELKLRV